jgi:uncharacterized protein (DUF1697 family)
MTYVSFVRNVTLGRKDQSNKAFIQAYLDAGASKATSFLASGNVVFEVTNLSPIKVSNLARGILREQIGFDEPAYIRSLNELAQTIDRQPFQNKPDGEIHSQFVTFLPANTQPFPEVPISSKRKDVTVFAIENYNAYSVTYQIKGRQGNATALLEQFTDEGLTTRNWNTICRLVRKFA